MTAGARGPAPRGRTRGARRTPLVPGSGPLSRVPPVAVFAVVVVVFAGGVLLGGVPGALLLALLACGVAALLAVTWARLSGVERVIRVFVLGVLVALVIALATGSAP